MSRDTSARNSRYASTFSRPLASFSVSFSLSSPLPSLPIVSLHYCSSLPRRIPSRANISFEFPPHLGFLLRSFPPLSLLPPPVHPPEPKPTMSVNLLSHPLVATKLSELRDKRTPSSRFRGLVKEISTLLAIEASRDLELKDVPNVSSLSFNFESRREGTGKPRSDRLRGVLARAGHDDGLSQKYGRVSRDS